MPCVGLGVISVICCALGALAAAGLVMLILYSLPVIYEGSEFDDTALKTEYDLTFLLVGVGGALALAGALFIYTLPRAGSMLALCGAAVGALAFLIPLTDWEAWAVILWLPAAIPLSAAAVVAHVRWRRIHSLGSPT